MTTFRVHVRSRLSLEAHRQATAASSPVEISCNSLSLDIAERRKAGYWFDIGSWGGEDEADIASATTDDPGLDPLL